MKIPRRLNIFWVISLKHSLTEALKIDGMESLRRRAFQFVIFERNFEKGFLRKRIPSCRAVPLHGV